VVLSSSSGRSAANLAAPPRDQRRQATPEREGRCAIMGPSENNSRGKVIGICIVLLCGMTVKCHL
jgi:tetrahydromethanopterin S-methyltransferase subunit B